MWSGPSNLGDLAVMRRSLGSVKKHRQASTMTTLRLAFPLLVRPDRSATETDGDEVMSSCQIQ